ncbi:MAG: Gfo/Idh/MocA family oxidoreductase [Thermoguttaceae bacterium]|nr:Gfo/Idh/MocA family oxidoreductase [Thermoguttaceae bacterium]
MPSITRRNFMKAGAMATAAGLVVPHVHAAGTDTIKIALIGCGGRGRGACFQALSTEEGPVKLAAIADAFQDQAEGFAKLVQEAMPDKCAFTKDTIFWGMDSYKKAIDALDPGDLVVLTAPGAFRPMHFEYAVKKGVHVFLEKPFGVDTPTLKRCLAAWEEAKKKNLKVITGLNNRKFFRTEETVKKIQDGAIATFFRAGFTDSRRTRADSIRVTSGLRFRRSCATTIRSRGSPVRRAWTGWCTIWTSAAGRKASIQRGFREREDVSPGRKKTSFSTTFPASTSSMTGSA